MHKTFKTSHLEGLEVHEINPMTTYNRRVSITEECTSAYCDGIKLKEGSLW
jgi:hypothetical protein